MGATNINMNENKTIKKTNPEKTIDQFSTDMLNLAINGINEAVARKQKEVNYWKNKAFILANKKGLCQQHEAKEAKHNFNNLGVSFETYIENGVDCADCNYKELEKKGN